MNESTSTLGQLLDEALELEPAEREKWLVSLDARFDDLKPRLHQLLVKAAEVEARDFLGALPPLAATEPGADLNTVEGQRIGPYRLDKLLGAGGMGVVWLASRADGLFERQVALKLPHRQRLSTDFAERMARERTILASLNHPNIARLYDAGFTTEGQPYLALEYVAGLRIDEFCRRECCGLAERLRLFLQVADAVASAHAQLVVHRDLKPANVLVTNSGDVRLLDFGIAKLLAFEGADSGNLTEVGGRALTPEYASPEQLRGDAITTASDVYSLGVVLFELLTGARPYRARRDTRGALEDAILQGDVTQPSQVEGPHARQLRGDLDTIVLKSLRTLPHERYATVNEFAADIRRHLAQQPIEARPASRRYVFGRFVKRNRVAVLAASIATVAILAGLAAATLGMIRARAAETQARGEAAKTRQVTDFVVDLFEVSDPGRARGQTITAREILDTAASRLDRELTSSPEVRAAMLATIADVYGKLGLYQEAEPLAAAALKTREQVLPGSVELADSLDQVGALDAQLGRVDAALARHDAALTLREATTEPNVLAIALTMRLRGDALKQGTRYREAQAVFRDVAARLIAAGQGESVESASTNSRLAETHNFLGERPQAEKLFRVADRIYRKALGADHPSVANNLHSLAILYRQTGRHALADATLTEVLTIQRRALGNAHPDVADTLNSRAMLLLAMERRDEALAVAKQSVAIYRTALGAEHNQTNLARVNLARVLTRLGRLEAAEQEYREVLATRRRTLPPGHEDVAVTLDAFAALLNMRGRHADAAKAATEARAIFTKTLGPEHWRTASAEIGLGEALAGSSDYAAGEAILNHACQASINAGPGREGQARACRSRLARLYEAWGKPDKAARYRIDASN